MLWASLPAGADPLEASRALAAAGAPQLALALMDRQQPDSGEDPEAWMRWQRARIALLSEQADWDALAAELADLPDGLPAAFYLWAGSVRVDALLNGGRGREARRLLARWIWFDTPDSAQLRQWRARLIRSYMVEGRSEDAYAAMLRFRQDYGPGDHKEALLRAQVLLDSNRPRDAATELNGVNTAEARALYLLATLRSGADASTVAEEASRRLARSGLSPEAALYLRAVVVEAARRSGDLGRAIAVLEPLVAENSAALKGILEVTPDQLWTAYLAYAREVGNRHHLLVGDDAAWWKLAETESDRYPVRSRSLFALLAREGKGKEFTQKAHGRFAEKVLALPQGEKLLDALYRRAEAFESVAAVPAPVRRLLADRAIARSDLGEAAKLMQGLAAPEGGSDRVLWDLRRAKVFLLGGDYERGEALLAQLAAGAARLDPPVVDRLIQVIFDLQTLGRHEAAHHLFEQLAAEVGDPRIRRELLYWMADSRKAQGRLRAAARLYLESATLPGVAAMDPWAQTARYEAARALAESGLVGDAENLYRQLLDATEDPQRRAVLARELEQLKLRHGDGGA